MYAPQPRPQSKFQSQPSPQPPQPFDPVSTRKLVYRRRAQRRHQRSISQANATVLLELGAKLVVNGLFTVAATTSLMRLVPHAVENRQELATVQSAVAIAEQDTSQLKSDFRRYFDPRQARSVMQEQSGWESPTERQVVWIDPTEAAPTSAP